MTTKYHYDCEFLENGKTIDLISIGIVCEDGREFYAVSSEFDTQAVAQHWWLMKNVMPSIEHIEFLNANPVTGMPVKDFLVTDKATMTRKRIRDGILDFVDGTTPEFWNWYGAYDHVALCQLFGKMIDLPSHFPMFSCDIKMLHKAAGYCEMPKQPAGLHNALADAKFNVVRYEYLTKLLSLEKQR